MFINNIDPILLHIGPFGIRYYGVIYVLGFIFSYVLFKYFANKDKLKINQEKIDEYFLWLIAGVIIGARIFEVFIYNPECYLSNIAEMFMLWHGGLSFHGGLVGAVTATWIFCKKNKVAFYDFVDILVIPAALALALGRIANFTNSELYGKITNTQSTPWCVVFQKIDGFCRHPTQIYESIKNIFMFFV